MVCSRPEGTKDVAAAARREGKVGKSCSCYRCLSVCMFLMLLLQCVPWAVTDVRLIAEREYNLRTFLTLLLLFSRRVSRRPPDQRPVHVQLLQFPHLPSPGLSRSGGQIPVKIAQREPEDRDKKAKGGPPPSPPIYISAKAACTQQQLIEFKVSLSLVLRRYLKCLGQKHWWDDDDEGARLSSLSLYIYNMQQPKTFEWIATGKKRNKMAGRKRRGEGEGKPLSHAHQMLLQSPTV